MNLPGPQPQKPPLAERFCGERKVGARGIAPLVSVMGLEPMMPKGDRLKVCCTTTVLHAHN